MKKLLTLLAIGALSTACGKKNGDDKKAPPAGSGSAAAAGSGSAAAAGSGSAAAAGSGSAAAAGSGSAAAPAACPPLKVTIDGVEVPGLVHGYAVTEKEDGKSSEQVIIYNHDKHTCEQLASKSGIPIEEGEVDVRANAGDTTTVGVGASTQFGVDVKLVSAAPTKPGDVVTLCVPETTVSGFGELKGKNIVVSGTFTGTYCGVRQF